MIRGGGEKSLSNLGRKTTRKALFCLETEKVMQELLGEVGSAHLKGTFQRLTLQKKEKGGERSVRGPHPEGRKDALSVTSDKKEKLAIVPVDKRTRETKYKGVILRQERKEGSYVVLPGKKTGLTYKGISPKMRGTRYPQAREEWRRIALLEEGKKELHRSRSDRPIWKKKINNNN